MVATRELPRDYLEAGSVDLKRDSRLPILLSVAGLVLFLGFGWLFVVVLGRLRPEVADTGLSFRFGDLYGLLALVLGATVLMATVVVAHEAVHGLFIWLFTRSKPMFDVGLGYASAGAPGWYLSRLPYLIVALAPLLVLTLLGLVVLALAPSALLLPTVAFLALNAGGAVGDLAVAVWVLLQPADCLMNDSGDRVTLYRRLR